MGARAVELLTDADHGARHTCATLMNLSGVPVAVIAA
jgi:hypothetical protein